MKKTLSSAGRGRKVAHYNSKCTLRSCSSIQKYVRLGSACVDSAAIAERKRARRPGCFADARSGTLPRKCRAPLRPLDGATRPRTTTISPTCLLTGGSISFLRFTQGAASGGLAAGRLDGGEPDGNSKMCLIVCLNLGLIMIVLYSNRFFVVCKNPKQKKTIKIFLS